ncbi:MAG: nitroreductase family protein [Candidatus Micrarchaeota archaeon]
MEFYETLDRRHSVRSFQGKEVENEKLGRILKAANCAPSAGNLQAYRIYAVSGGEKREELMMACMGQECVLQAPVLLIFVASQQESAAKYGERGAQLYSIQDATIAAAYAQLAAAAEGLGSVWVGAFDPLEVARLIDAESYEVPVAVLPIGYPAEESGPSDRKNLGDLVKEV